MCPIATALVSACCSPSPLLSQSLPTTEPCRKTRFARPAPCFVPPPPLLPALRPPKQTPLCLDRSVKSDQNKEEQSQGEGLVGRTTETRPLTDGLANMPNSGSVFQRGQVGDQMLQFCDYT